MWGWVRQRQLRRLAWAVTALFLPVAWACGWWRPGDFASAAGCKYELTHWQLAFAGAGPWRQLTLALALLLGSGVGMPLALLLLVAMLALGPLPGAIAVAAAETAVQLWLRRRRRLGMPAALDPVLSAWLAEPDLDPLARGVWPRLFLALPRRTLDLLALEPPPPAPAGAAPAACPFPLVVLANLARVAVTAGWLFALRRLAEDHQPFPGDVLPLLLTTTALLLAGVALPWMPELLPGTPGVARLAACITGEPPLASTAAGEAAGGAPAVAATTPTAAAG